MRFVPAVLLALAAPLWGTPVISEFMASNQTSIVDEDGAHSDWIEIFNPSGAPVNMAGWALTDNASQPQKWVFPAVTIPANGRILVFASSKDRVTVPGNLHTNFSLSVDGEYLGLIAPDGTTVSTEFAPKFPPQLVDVSYGTSSNTMEVTVVDKGTPLRALVPTDNSLGTTWRMPGFSDAAWVTGTFGVGFFGATANPNLSADLGTNLQASMENTARNSYSRAYFNVANPANVTKLMLKVKYDDGFHAWVNGAHATNSPNAPAEATLTFSSTASNHGPTLFETFDISSKIPDLVAGSNVIAFQGMNTTASSSDCFLLPQLMITTSAPGTEATGYFTAATPGTENGGTSTVVLPISVAFSRPPGPFASAFALTLSGAGSGQKIYYTMADPSASPGAVLPEPTIASTEYVGPIAISSSKILRAAIFETATGRKGPTTSAQYLLLETGGTNNTSNFTSNLPILVVDDHGAGTPVDSNGGAYTTGFIHAFPTVNGVATLNSQPASFTRAGMRVRGSSSASFPKKSLGIELWNELNTDRDIALLGMSSDSDWVLNGPYQYDDSYIHNHFIYEVSRRIGRWAPRTMMCEVFLNQDGGKLDYVDYNGVYVLTEKIKSNSSRLDIAEIEPEDIAGEPLTGGYIFKIDRTDADEVNWTTTTGVPASDKLVIVEPDPQFDTTQQVSYLQSYVQAFDTVLLNERNAGFTTRNYRNYMDSASWVDHHILNAMGYNVDALRLSAYFHKDRNKRIAAGPAWDFDRALGSDDGRDSNPSSWANIDYFFTRDWWGRLFQDPDFVMAWVDRWQQLRNGPLATANLTAIADQFGAQIGNTAGARDAAKWTQNAAAGGVYLNEIAAMKTWLTTRMAWIDAQMPAGPTASRATGVVTAGSLVTLTAPSGTIRYTLNGSDPRPAGGASGGSGTAYAGALAINQTTVITTRRDFGAPLTVFTGMAAIGTNWSGVTTRVYLVNEDFAIAGDIAVSEINYHPLNPTPAESVALPGVETQDFEFIELRNVGARKVNLFEVKFADTQPFKELVLAPFTLNPGDCAFVVKNRAAFALRYGAAMSSRIVGEWQEGGLDDGGERIVLTARNGTAIQDFTYGDGGDWPGRADGKGSTLEYRGITFTNADFANPANWRPSSEFHGSPGIAGQGPDPRIAINEILSHTALPFVDAIELKNRTGAPIAIGGWYLSNVTDPENASSYKQYQIPAGTTIGAGGYVVFDETQFNPNGVWNPARGTPGAGEFEFDGFRDNDALLIATDGSGNPVSFVDKQEFGAARLNEAWGRFPDGTGPLFPMVARTCLNEGSPASPRPRLGAANSTQRSGPLIISEVHHTPSGGNTDLEFVEIRNPTGQAQSLFNWRLRGAVDFNFNGELLPAGGVLVVVPFAPTDIAKANTFRAAYQMSAALPLLGPWTDDDHLGTAGTVTLYRAEAPPQGDPYFTPRTQEDTVDYASGGLWPVSTNGKSLNRRGNALSGGEAGSWKADLPSPGTYGSTLEQWLAAAFPSGGAGSAAGHDPDGDGASNALEYSRGSNPLVNESHIALAPHAGPDHGVGRCIYLHLYPAGGSAWCHLQDLAIR